MATITMVVFDGDDKMKTEEWREKSSYLWRAAPGPGVTTDRPPSPDIGRSLISTQYLQHRFIVKY
jgi:hypothetical protein